MRVATAAALALCGLYVLGGLYFGVVFVYLVTLPPSAYPDGRLLAPEVGGGSTPSNPPGRSGPGGIPLPQLPRLPGSVTDVLPEWEGTERVNILLMGVDQRDDERAAGVPPRSDTMLVLSIDPVAKRAGLVSFPRDLLVTIPGLGQERINVAYRYGELAKLPGGGPELAKRTIEQNFGLTVHYYARVDFRGFERIVDTLGGVLVDVEVPLKDDEYPTEDYGITRIYIPAGPQVLDGKTALQYARSRHGDPDGDFGRMRRQQRLLLALRDRSFQLDLIPKAPTLIELAQETISTDLSPRQLLALARLAQEIERDDIRTLVLDRDLAVPFKGPGGADYLMPRTAEIRQALQNLMSS